MRTHPIPPSFASPLPSAQPRLPPLGNCHRPRARYLLRVCSIPPPHARPLPAALVPVACHPRARCLQPSRSFPAIVHYLPAVLRAHSLPSSALNPRRPHARPPARRPR
ncbi:hypothetical protein B0H14DRAFT_3480741 [Mycena olivaceomarginata]|nr:hypothetical protein B0H14DRAFT_3480741 [Mycena olivaceomarginata]